MNPDNPIEKELTELGQHLGSEGLMARRVLQRIGDEDATALPRRHIWQMKWPISLGSALAASLLIVLFVHLGNEKSSSSGSLFAQAIEAMKSAKSLHLLVNEWQGDRSRPVFEVFYESGAGLRQENNYNPGSPQMLVDDTQHQWVYSPKSPLVRRRKSVDSIGQVVRKILDPNKLLAEGRRDPTGDVDVDRELLRLYVFERKYNGFTNQMRMWVDSNRRPRKVEGIETSDDGNYRKRMTTEVTYDIPIDHKLFAPDLPARAKIVEVDTLLEQNFSLDKALFKREALGMTFAVHRVVQVPFGLAVLTSIRPTDETRRLVGDVDEPRSNFARYDLNDSNNPAKHYQYDVYELTRVFENGMIAKWHFLGQNGWWPDDLVDQYCPSFSITAEGAWAAYLTKAGKQTWEKASPQAKIAAIEKRGEIADLLKEIYSQTEPLGTFVRRTEPMSDEQMQPLWDKGLVPRDERLSKSDTFPLKTLEEFQKEFDSRMPE